MPIWHPRQAIKTCCLALERLSWPDEYYSPFRQSDKYMNVFILKTCLGILIKGNAAVYLLMLLFSKSNVDNITLYLFQFINDIISFTHTPDFPFAAMQTLLQAKKPSKASSFWLLIDH